MVHLVRAYGVYEMVDTAIVSVHRRQLALYEIPLVVCVPAKHQVFPEVLHPLNNRTVINSFLAGLHSC